MDDKGESVAVPLTSPDNGHVALIARIDNTSPIGAKLINLNRIISLDVFAKEIPGANLIVNG